MEEGLKILSGPDKWQLILALFEPDQCNMVPFEIEGEPDGNTWVSVGSGTRKDGDGQEWELDCLIPFTGGWHIRVQYSLKTCTGMVLKSWQDESESDDASQGV